MFWNKIPSVTTEELKNLLKERPVVIDVREPYEFKARHIKGAKNIPLSTIKTYEGKGPVYLVCQSGARSGRYSFPKYGTGIQCDGCHLSTNQ